ncbi:MAG: hypothetical protein GC178_10640 [Flavobacteriales bacterium]|nr:hypothetical protein [Flavobacteriales bacterium]
MSKAKLYTNGVVELFDICAYGWIEMKETVGLLTILCLLIAGCRNCYNEMIDWSEKVPQGSSIEEVKKLQPEFLSIAWDMPDTVEWYLEKYPQDTLVRFLITDVCGGSDLLHMENRLEFINGGYIGREAFN